MVFSFLKCTFADLRSKMVLLAAAVCNKAGRAIISRQFVEMTRSRIEGLLAAFPKLMGSGKQHTFVETESVRYVYQPLEKLYMLLITTKASNILEDLETLRLFARVVPEYCSQLEEREVLDQAFSVLFAFDEVVALGYRENVNMNQIRTFTEMDSHEEKVFQAVRETQEREAKENMKRKAKELAMQRKGLVKSGSANMYGGMGRDSRSTDGLSLDSTINDSVRPAMSVAATSYTKPQETVKRPGGMKLTSRGKEADQFLDQLKTEGETVEAVGNRLSATSITSAAPTEPVCCRLEEKLTARVGRDSGLEKFELQGLLNLRITDKSCERVRVKISNSDERNLQLQTHPNIDKKLFVSDGVIGLKQADRPFPIGQDIGVLKWRLVGSADRSSAEQLLPLLINCWPNETPNGCEVNIEFELGSGADYELRDVHISIPLPPGSGSPKVTACDGDYQFERAKGQLIWFIDFVNKQHRQGALEFTTGSGQAADFFPVSVQFNSQKLYCLLSVDDVTLVDSGNSAKFSANSLLTTDSFQIV